MNKKRVSELIIQNADRFEYYIIKQLFNDVSVPRCHTENLSYGNIFIPFKNTLLLYSRFYFFGHKYKGHDFLRAGAFAPVAPPSATRLGISVIMSWFHVFGVILLVKSISLKGFCRTFFIISINSL